MWQQTKQVKKNQNECRAKFFNVFFNLEIWYKRTYQYLTEARTSHEAILQNFNREYTFWQVLFPIRANVSGFKMQRRSSQLNKEPYAVAEFRQDGIFPGFLFATA